MNMRAAIWRSGRQAWIWLCYIAVISLSFWAAWLLRFDFAIPNREWPTFREGLAIVLAAKIVVFCVLRLYRDRWFRYSGFADLIALLRTNLLASMVACSSLYLLIGLEFPRSVCCLDLLLCIVTSGGVRFAARLFHELRVGRNTNGSDKGLLIYGAGVAGLALAREIRGNPKLGYKVIGFLDDDPRKRDATLLGLPVLGSGHQAQTIVDAHQARRPSVAEIVVTMPSASSVQVREAMGRCRSTGVPCRTVPGLGELLSGTVRVGSMNQILVTDLLGREPVTLDLNHVRRAITGRQVLVTGAAGSIGSELCNQLAQLAPGELIALDQAESELFRLEAELRGRYPGLALAGEIGDIRDLRRMEEIIEQHGVDVIYHAAAYKHVPVMERHICEAVRNNVIGTWNLVQAAWRANVSRFLLISSDKAVNPSSVMGLTKRVAELIASSVRPQIGRGPATRFVSVRFGNVLVSNGSVVPIFQKQIAAGGPVTVTHRDMRRYFMTVQEAVQLVLQASTMGKGSEVFVLDMGRPVRIVDLARKMITLAGLVPDEDIEIRFVGLRPGEKMFEEISLDAENVLPTSHERIRVFQGQQVSFNELVPWIAELHHLLWRRDSDLVINHLRTLVPEYQPIPAAMPANAEESSVRARAAAAFARGTA